MAKRRKQQPAGVPEWVVTYGDMMSLLLCFFILLAAFSELKKPDEYQKVIDAIQHAFGVDGGDSRIIDELDLQSNPWSQLEGVLQKIDKERSRSDTNDTTTVGVDQTTSTLFNGRKWTIGKPLPFAAAASELTEEHQAILRDLIAPRIRDNGNLFLIVGHAWGPDDRLGGADLMEVSYRRALAVHAFLIEECDTDENLLSLWIAGDTQPLQLGSAGGGVVNNRRVEVFMTDVPVAELHPDANGTGRAD